MSELAAAGVDHSGQEKWLAPPVVARLAAGLIGGLLRGQLDRASFEQVAASARAGRAILVTDFRNVVTVAAALEQTAAVVLPRERSHDGIARAVEALSSRTIRLATGTRGIAAQAIGDTVAVMPVSDEPGVGWKPIDVSRVASALGRRVMVITVAAERVVPLDFGLPSTIGLAFGAARAQAVDGSRRLRGPAGQALAAESIAHVLTGPMSPAAPGAPRPRLFWPLPLQLYRASMSVMALAAPLYLASRRRGGKEDGSRLGERRGRASAPRPDGRLVWLHGASVGESLSILPLIEALFERNLADSVLITTGTLTSAQIMEERLPDRAIHQFVPLDAPIFARRFLDHWRPDAAVFVESELWPNLMREAARRNVPLAIVNGRMSKRSFERWRRVPRSARAVLATTRLVLAQSQVHASRFAMLGARQALDLGNLKFDGPVPPFDQTAKGDLDEAIRIRPVWLAASTHAGEEAAIAKVHLAARDRYPNLLTIIVPRHPHRGEEVRKTFEEQSLTVARRGAGNPIGQEVEIYIADTIGELGLFYRLTRIAFVGGSLTHVGGHNPIEPARLGCAILHGPHVENFVDIYEAFDTAGGALSLDTEEAVAEALTSLLADPPRLEAMAEANRSVIERNAGSLPRAIAALEPLLRSQPGGQDPRG